jgi:Uma2 family endonuclease
MTRTVALPATPSRTQVDRIPPLENGDRLHADEFERRWEAMPDLKRAELIDGTVYIAHPTQHRLIDPTFPPLENGDRMTRAQFERAWDNMPDLKKAELLNGVVYMAPPVSAGHHGMPHSDLVFWLGSYRVRTPGVDQAADSTLRLPGDNDPQPDASLFVLREYSGTAWLDDKGYLRGTPNLVAEVSATSASYDRHQKLEVYRAAGIAEYLIHRVFDGAIDWFALRDGRYQPLPVGTDGVVRSVALPGLWLDPEALVGRDMARVSVVLQAGLASPEHAAFVERLRAVAATAP